MSFKVSSWIFSLGNNKIRAEILKHRNGVTCFSTSAIGIYYQNILHPATSNLGAELPRTAHPSEEVIVLLTLRILSESPEAKQAHRATSYLIFGNNTAAHNVALRKILLEFPVVLIHLLNFEQTRC